MNDVATQTPARRHTKANGEQPADVLVVFGITGDLARVMTFRSLYRLERDGLLDLPDRRRRGRRLDARSAGRARTGVDRRHRRGARRGGVRPVRGAALVRAGRLRRRVDLRTRRRGDRGHDVPVFYLEIPPFLFATVITGLADAGLTSSARVVVEKPFGHDPAVGSGAGRGAARVRGRVAAVPDRPLPREDGSRGDPVPALRQHDARAGLEPQPRRVRPDHDGGGLRRRGPRPFLRPGRRAARRRRQPPDAGGRGGGDGGAGRRRPETLKDAQVAVFRAIVEADPAALRAWPVRRLPSASTASPPTRPPRPTPRSGSRSITGAGRAFRSSSAPASGLPVTQTELRLVFKHAPRLGFAGAAARGRSRTSS